MNLEYAIRGDGRNPGYQSPQAARGFFIDHPVHKMYVLTFPVDNETWIYNVTTGLWSRRESNGIGRWRANSSVLFNNEVLVGDYREGTIWLLTEDEFTENGVPLKYQLVPPVIRDKDTDIYVESVELFMEVGVGSIDTVDDLGVKKAEPIKPLVQFEYSKDGGASWQQKQDLSIGRVGERDIRVKSRLFGRVRYLYGFLLRFTVTDDVPVEMYELHVNISRGG